MIKVSKIKHRKNPDTIILLLDIDGVLVLKDDIFDSKCVNILNEILIVTNCDIIISSKWKTLYTLNQLGNIFEYNGIFKKPIGFTPNLRLDSGYYTEEEIRTNEILNWVNINNPKKWCAVDDLNLLLPNENFVWIKTPKKGLTYHRAKDKIISNLK